MNHLLNRAVMLLVVLLAAPGWSQAQGIIFVGDMEERSVDVLFPVVGGQPRLPDGPASEALQWVLQQLVPGVSPTDQEINARFSPAWLNSTPLQQTRDFLLAIQNDYPNAVVNDLIQITPMSFTGLIRGSSGNEAFVTLGAGFSSGQINTLGVSFFGTGGGSVVFLADQGLDINQAADRFATLSTEPGLLVARVDGNDQCNTIVERNSSALRATASIFKIWVQGAVADAVADRSTTTDEIVLRADSERAPGGPVINEPANTPFTVDELSRLMLGQSDNTATNMLHLLTGRERNNRVVTEFGHATPEALTPFLNISEQFHLFFSFPLVTAQGYVNGTEMFQQDFVVNSIEPLGSISDGPNIANNTSLFTTGSWRASAMDVCSALASQRTWANGSDQAMLVDRALGAGVAQPNLRNNWDRVWYKGGSLTTGGGLDVVLTHAWLLENSGEDPYVVVALSNSPNADIDGFAIQSITGRILELLPTL
ncbi:MAG: serine hydrolase [Xanthomonadales bacterium]|nr:serine hydrolase [Xanthomonadales bacterium]